MQSTLTLLSSMTVLRDSIHMGSTSPSSTIHLGFSLVMLERSRMRLENRPTHQIGSGVCYNIVMCTYTYRSCVSVGIWSV